MSSKLTTSNPDLTYRIPRYNNTVVDNRKNGPTGAGRSDNPMIENKAENNSEPKKNIDYPEIRQNLTRGSARTRRAGSRIGPRYDAGTQRA